MSFEVYSDGHPPAWGIRAVFSDRETLIREVEQPLDSLLRVIKVVDLKDLRSTAERQIYCQVLNTIEHSLDPIKTVYGDYGCQDWPAPYDIYRSFCYSGRQLQDFSTWEAVLHGACVKLLNYCAPILGAIGEEAWPTLVAHPQWPLFLEVVVEDGVFLHDYNLGEILRDFPALNSIPLGVGKGIGLITDLLCEEIVESYYQSTRDI